MKAIEILNLKKSYRKGFWKTKFTVLQDLSFCVQAGKITGFLGGNGTGKTTTLKCILNLAIPDSGQIIFFEESPLSQKICRRIGFLPERPYFYEYLSGREFLNFYGQLSANIKAKEIPTRVSELLKRVRLEHAADRPLRTYSKGMLQRIGLAQALIHRPELVLLDEPMAGLDPDGRLEMAQIILETAKTGAAVFFSSHLLHDAESLCEDIVILKKGDLAYQGSTRKLLDGLNTGFRISFRSQNKSNTLRFNSQEELQSGIDRVRQQNGVIDEVAVERPSLEEAFARIGGAKQ